MPASTMRYILGERYWLLSMGNHKVDAANQAKEERRRGYKARIEKIVRGNYWVWTTRKWANL